MTILRLSTLSDRFRRQSSVSLSKTLKYRRGLSNHAVVYSNNGDPSKVLEVRALPELEPPPARCLNLRMLLSPVNPADVNVVQGVYPIKPPLREDLGDIFIGGNEGVAEVVAVGEGSPYRKGDWVVCDKSQLGTWRTSLQVQESDVMRCPGRKLSAVHAATLTVNPFTAQGMLNNYVKLQPGDTIIQNGANSAVGQVVIQLAKHLRIQTINFVRDRPNLEELKQELIDMGATKVLTYQDLEDKSLRTTVKDWTGGKDIRLALNCVGGRETSLMAGLLGKDAHIVSYGAMSKSPLSFPTSLFIFKNLTAHGYHQSRRHKECSFEERQAIMKELVDLMESGKIREAQHEIVELYGTVESMTARIRQTFSMLNQGRYGKKVLLRFSSGTV